MYKKKAQAAMEFLMTYGWAILVVLAAIGALAYFGVLSPDRFLPEQCTMQSGFHCADHKQIDSTHLLLQIENAGGDDINNVTLYVNDTITATYCNVVGSGNNNATNAGSLSNGQKSTYTVTCSAGLNPGKFKGKIYLDYVSGRSGIGHTATGEIIQKVN